MSTSLEEVWALFREVAESQKETARRFQETERLMKEQSQETEHKFQETERLMKEQSQETERKFQETERLMKEQSQETERKFQETERLMKEQSQETERKFQETERLMKEQSQETERKFQETERLMKEQSQELAQRIRETDRQLSNQLGKLGNRLGEFVEGLVKPALVRLFQTRGIVVYEVYTDVEVNRSNEGLQIDLLVVNSTEAVLVEVKSKLTHADVQEHLERMDKFKRLMPRYADVQAMGAVAAMVIPAEVARYAYQQGLFVLAQSGANVVIRNDEAFQPRIW